MNNKKLVVFIAIFISLFLVFLFLYNKQYNYEYTYEIDGYQIVEYFSVDELLFKFVIDDEYEFYLNGEYSVDRGLITDVTIEDSCIYLEGNLDFYSICKEDSLYYFNEINLISLKTASYQNLNIYDLSGFTYFIWDYDGFIYISEDEKKKITIFENDVYSPSLIKQIGNYLFIPNYDEDYYFSSYILIDMENVTYKEISLDSKINFDMAYLSYSDTSISIYDKKNEKVYTIKISNGNQETKQGITYSESELNTYEDIYNYFSINNNYLKYQLNSYEVYLDNYEIEDIVYENIEEVIFLDNSDLLYYNLTGDLVKIFEYSEWEFNYSNLIFVY